MVLVLIPADTLPGTAVTFNDGSDVLVHPGAQQLLANQNRQGTYILIFTKSLY